MPFFWFVFCVLYSPAARYMITTCCVSGGFQLSSSPVLLTKSHVASHVAWALSLALGSGVFPALPVF